MTNLSNWISSAAIVMVFLASAAGFRAWGQQETKIEQLITDRVEDRAEQKALRDELNVLNTTMQLQQKDQTQLLRELELLNRRLERERQ